jgi:AraC-like DNA-binding protein
MSTSGSANASPLTIHVSYVGAVGRHLAGRGFDPGPLYAAIGLTTHEVEQGQLRVPLRDFFALLDSAAHRAADPHVGLHIYERFDFADLGLLGFALLSSKDVGAALRVLMRYGTIFQDGDEGQLLIEDDYAHIWYRVKAPDLPLSRHDCDMSTAFPLFFLRKVLDPDWTPVAVQLQHPTPERALRGEYERVFGCPLSFGAATNQITLPRLVLEAPIRSSDKRLFDIIEGNLLLLQEQSRLENSLARRVEAAIVKALALGPPRLEQIARTLGMSPSMLQSQLLARSLKFNELLDKARYDLATRLLATSAHSLAEITYLLGYSEESAFIRAFRRWMSCTPNDYRHSARSGVPPHGARGARQRH